MPVYTLLFLQDVSGINVSSEGDGETGSVILGIVDLLVSEMLSLPYHKTTIKLQTSVVGKRGSPLI